MSVTKSVVGCIAGVLVEQGLLDPDKPASTYVPEIVGSGYDGATVRHLLNMRTGVAFREEYTNPDAEVRVMERYMGWRPGEDIDGHAGCTSTSPNLALTPITVDRSSTDQPIPTCSAGCVNAPRAHAWPTSSHY